MTDDEDRPLRARVTLVVDVHSAGPLEVTEEQLWHMVADRFGRVCDNGPHTIAYGVDRREAATLAFGRLTEGPTTWMDGSAPPTGFHCGRCREPKVPGAGPCLKTVPWGTGTRPCQSDDAQHHGQCWHAQPLGPVPL